MKTHTLTKKRDFDLVVKHGRWSRGRDLDLKALRLKEALVYLPSKENKNDFVSQLKLAISVGTKISKKAVVRNKLKRKIREALRLLWKDKAPESGYYALVVPRPTAIDKNLAELREDLKLLLEKNKIIKKNAGI